MLAEADLKETNQKSKVKLKTLAKYFTHGILFSILFLVLTIVLGYLAAFLTEIDLLLVVLIGFWLLCPIIGFANSIITSLLWFKVEMSFSGILVHGFIFLIALFIVNTIVIVVPPLVFPGTVTVAVTFIIGTFIDGVICKIVAELWR